jgi:threonine dehydrogenase-like Zn-dependent dehydrogenase
LKAIILQPGTKNIRLNDWVEPQIHRPTELKARVLLVGICGTDREEASGGRANAPAGESELIIGHEMLAEVVEIGKKVSHFQVGDRVVITVRRGCSLCEACLAFRSDYCMTGKYTERGIKGAHGFQSTFVVDDEIYGVKVPQSLGDAAVLAEPMSVVQKAIEETILIQSRRLSWLKDPLDWLKGKTACVAGLGPIGMLAALVLRLKGAQVVGLDRSAADGTRAQLLKAMGGSYINDKTFDTVAFKKQHPDIQLIVDAAGVAKFDFDLISLLGINGILVLTGVPGEQPQLSIDGSRLFRQLVLCNQVVVGSVNESIAHFAQGLKDLETASQKWPGVVEKFITHRFSYTNFEQGFVKHGSDEIKAVIDWRQ